MKLSSMGFRLLMGAALAVGVILLIRPGFARSPHRDKTTTHPRRDILAEIPAPGGESASDREIRKWMDRARRGGDDKAWANLGDALMQKARETGDQKYYGFAERTYARALDANPRSTEAMTGMAWVNGGRHAFDKSIEWANRALALDPRSAAAYGLISDAEVERGEYDAAFTHTQKMLDIRPDISSYSRGAWLLYVTGDLRKAKWLIAKAIMAGAPYAENTCWCRAQLALMLFNEGNIVAAEQALVEGLKGSPANHHLLAAMGKIKAARRDYKSAIDFYRRAVAAYPDHNSLVALADLYALTGDRAAAEKQTQAVLDFHNRTAANGGHDHMQMAQFYADHDRDLVEALRLAEEHKTSKNVFEADTLAWCYYKNSDIPNARKAIQRALSRNTPDARILYHAGLIAAKAGDEALARKRLYQALSMNPSFHPTQAADAANALKKLGAASPWDRLTVEGQRVALAEGRNASR